jgi:hypothetical protein
MEWITLAARYELGQVTQKWVPVSGGSKKGWQTWVGTGGLKKSYWMCGLKMVVEMNVNN